MEEGNAGLELVANAAKMQELFVDESSDISEPALPALAYNEDGYRGEIEAYLSQVREFAVQNGKRKFLGALSQEYDSIPESEFASKHKVIQDELTESSNELESMPSETEYMNCVAGDGTYLQKEFFPILPGGMTKRLIIDMNAEDAKKHDMVVGQKATVLLLPRQQVQYLHAARPKGLHMLSFNCNDQRLNDLIKEE